MADDSEGISLREFGRRINVSGEAVRKAVNKGRIPAAAVGRKKFGNKTRPMIIDPELAATAWGDNVQVTQQRDKAKMRAAGQASAAAKAGRAAASATTSGGDGGGSDDGGGQTSAGRGPSTAESQRVEAAYKARLKKLEYEERIGKMVSAEQIRGLYMQQIVDARTKLMALGRRARGRLPHLTVDDVETIEELTAEALEELTVGSPRT